MKTIAELLKTASELAKIDTLESRFRIFEICRQIIFLLGPTKCRKTGHES